MTDTPIVTIRGLEHTISQLRCDNEILQNNYNVAVQHEDELGIEVRTLRAENERLSDVVASLLDGLDANSTDECGLTDEEWQKRVREAHRALEGSKLPTDYVPESEESST